MSWKSKLILFVIVSLSTCLFFGCKKQIDQKNNNKIQFSTEVLSKSTLLATVAKDEAPLNSDPSSKHSNEVKDVKPKDIIVNFAINGRGNAYIAQIGDKVGVIHNNKRGKLYDSIETFTLTLSPDGQRVAYGAKYGNFWYIVIDGREHGPYFEIGKPSFSSDSRMVAYEAKEGELWNVFLGDKRSPDAISLFNRPIFNKNLTKLFWVENTKNENEFLYVTSDLDFNVIQKTVMHTTKYTTNVDNEFVAVVDKLGDKERVIEFNISNPDTVKKGMLYDEVRDLVFSQNGKELAYFASRGKQLFVVLNGKNEEIPRGSYPSPPVIRPDGKATGIIVSGDDWAFVHHSFKGVSQKNVRYQECADVAFSKDSKHVAYVAIKNGRFIIVTNGVEGPPFDRVISPQFSPDSKTLVYRARQDGKRFVVIADAVTGKVIREHPRYERVFETTFTADGKSVAYGVMDKNELWWKVEQL